MTGMASFVALSPLLPAAPISDMRFLRAGGCYVVRVRGSFGSGGGTRSRGLGSKQRLVLGSRQRGRHFGRGSFGTDGSAGRGIQRAAGGTFRSRARRKDGRLLHFQMSDFLLDLRLELVGGADRAGNRSFGSGEAD